MKPALGTVMMEEGEKLRQITPHHQLDDGHHYGNPRWPVKLLHFWPGQIPPPLST